MSFAESRSETVPVQLPNGAIAKFEVTTTGREDVSFDSKQFQPVADAIEGVVQMIAAPLQKVKPKKATVKFGMELAIESGQLTAVIVKGSGKANRRLIDFLQKSSFDTQKQYFQPLFWHLCKRSNLEITLEWEAQPKA